MSSTQEVGDIFGDGIGPAQAMLRAPTVLILCVGLWGMNIFFYRLFNLDYKYIFNYDLIEIQKEEKEKCRRSGSNGSSSGDEGYAETEQQDIEMSTMDNSSSNLTTTVAGSTMIATTRSPKKVSSRSRSPKTRHSSTSIDTNKKSKSSSSASAPSVLQTPSSSSDNNSSLEQLTPTIPELFAFQGQPGSSIVWYKLVMFSILLLVILHYTTHYWMDHLKRGSIGAVGFFYCIVLLYIFLPIKQNEWLRRSFVIIVKRTYALLHPRCFWIRFIGKPLRIPRRIPFIDVFYADAMCSLSKVFFDWGMLSHAAVHYPNPVPAATHNIIIPSLCAALPYLIRARQCLIMYTVCQKQRDPHKTQHLMNAFKYSTSMYPLILSAYIQTYNTTGTEVVPTYLNNTLIVLLIINASYSLYWDIVMDWGMMQDPYKVAQTACRVGMPSSSSLSIADTTKGHTYNPVGLSSSNNSNDTSTFNNNFHHICLRPRLRYGFTLSTLIVIADSFLRFSWTLKFIAPNLFPSNDAFVLCTQFLEVFRRAIWNLLRVEWENMKQQKTKLLLINNNNTNSTHSHHLHHDGKAPDSLSDHGDFEPNDHDLHLHHYDDDEDVHGQHHQGGLLFEMQPLGGTARHSRTSSTSSSVVVDETTVPTY